jgi:hypothetical protein
MGNTKSVPVNLYRTVETGDLELAINDRKGFFRSPANQRRPYNCG